MVLLPKTLRLRVRFLAQHLKRKRLKAGSSLGEPVCRPFPSRLPTFLEETLFHSFRDGLDTS
jgi:hypothetical protein